MNAQLKVPALLILAALAAVPLSAAVESMKVEPTFVPRLCPAMEMEGVTEARLVVAVAVDETGKLTETLVLGYTHPAFVRMGLDALQEWNFTPASVDGKPISSQTELTIEYSAQGVVVSRSGALDLDRFVQQQFGVRFAKRPLSARELDRVPTRVNTVSPRYARQAEDEGVKGAVQVYFYIDESGAVRMPSVAPGSDPYLAQSAVAAVRDWKFEPPMRKGVPVVVSARQEFKFGS